MFQKEILQQNYWSPADDLGRIKLVISEGFPRDSLSMPIERVKNLVAFSFQHAPLGKSQLFLDHHPSRILLFCIGTYHPCTHSRDSRELVDRLAESYDVAARTIHIFNACAYLSF